MMSRSMYQFTPEVLEFKNKEGKLMVLYDIGTCQHMLVCTLHACFLHSCGSRDVDCRVYVLTDDVCVVGR